jgi:hypothetical protein
MDKAKYKDKGAQRESGVSLKEEKGSTSEAIIGCDPQRMTE